MLKERAVLADGGWRAYFDQPQESDVLVDETHAVMTRITLKQLPDYSCSIPTGNYVGKRWRRAYQEGWLMGEMTNPDPVTGLARNIIWREVLVL